MVLFTIFSQVAKFYSLTAWNCEKGAESVNSGAQQFHDFVLVSNDMAGYEGKLILDGPQFDENDGPGLFNSLIVASDPQLRGKSTAGGVIIPYMNGFLIKNVIFYNFDQVIFFYCSSIHYLLPTSVSYILTHYWFTHKAFNDLYCFISSSIIMKDLEKKSDDTYVS